jgi:hypothetical protein
MQLTFAGLSPRLIGIRFSKITIVFFFTEQYHEILKTTTGWLFCEAGDNFEWVHKNNINNKILG